MEYEKGSRRNSARIDAYTQLVFKSLEEPTRKNEKITDEAKKNTWTLKVYVDFSQYQRPHRMTPEIAAIKVSTISIVDPIQDEPLTSTVVSIEGLRLRSEYIDAVFNYRENMNDTSNPSLKLIEGSTLRGMLHFIEMLQSKKYYLEDVESAIDALQISDFIVMRPFAQKWLIPLITNIELPEYFGARTIELAALLKMARKTHNREEFERLILEMCEDSRELAAVASMSMSMPSTSQYCSRY
ncbi:hypothetical protein PRIPAC_97876 [Pristionchus pacificus]|nr:hypothetical protein PRIPAC_97876 [Pristionchus pacificus]